MSETRVVIPPKYNMLIDSITRRDQDGFAYKIEVVDKYNLSLQYLEDRLKGPKCIDSMIVSRLSLPAIIEMLQMFQSEDESNE